MALGLRDRARSELKWQVIRLREEGEDDGHSDDDKGMKEKIVPFSGQPGKTPSLRFLSRKKNTTRAQERKRIKAIDTGNLKEGSLRDHRDQRTRAS